MRSITAIPAFMALLPSVLTAPSLTLPRADTQNINIVVQRIKSTGEVDMAVTKSSTSQVVGYTCSSSLSTGSFASLPISTDIDENGSGTMTIGFTAYKIHEDPNLSGGIICIKMYNEVEMYLTCAASAPSSMELKPVDVKRDTCFSSAAPGMHIAANAMLTGGAPPPAGNATKREAEPLNKRQVPCSQWSDSTQVSGDGNPHQNYLLKQLSENIACGAAPTCSVGQTQSMSYSIGWFSSATVEEWLTGGFDVSASWTTGNTYTCGGNSGDTICVWYKTAHTAYTVQNGMYNDCTGFQATGGTAILYSPNSNNVIVL